MKFYAIKKYHIQTAAIFGIKGAIVGSFKAGLLNAGTGIVRGIGDTISDSITDSKFKKAEKLLPTAKKFLIAYATL